MAAAVMTFSPRKSALPAVTPAEERRIAGVLRTLDEDFAGPLSLESLAGEAGMSRYHFLRTFQRVTGQTPWRYILSRRLTHAGHDLVAGGRSVLESSTAAGFMDLSEFNRQFHRYFGVTQLDFGESRFISAIAYPARCAARVAAAFLAARRNPSSPLVCTACLAARCRSSAPRSRAVPRVCLESALWEALRRGSASRTRLRECERRGVGDDCSPD